jgi:glucose/arabinose dehydrogenase
MRRVVLLIVIGCGQPVLAQAQLRVEVVASGLSRPLLMVPDPVFREVAYVVEQGGLVKTFRHGQLLAEPFADLRGIVSDSRERGLLGMAFSPDAASGRVFFYFSDVRGAAVLARFRRDSSAPVRVDGESRVDLRWPSGERLIQHPSPIHYGGHLAFGPDGYLYVGVGDGASPYDVENNAQNPSLLLGKMLRIDVTVPDDDPTGYRVPPDNPFLDGDPISALGEVWAFGLRNPWRYSFDDVGAGATGALIIAHVGQDSREEINYEPAGAGGRNYGWRVREGRIPTPGVITPPAYAPLTEPILDYSVEGRSVTGGFVYRGTALGPAYRGRYFFADFASSRVWSLGLALDPATGQATVSDVIEHTAELGGSLGGIASFGRDLNGELYLVTFGGQVLKLVPLSDPKPTAPVVQAVVQGNTVTLQWTRSPVPEAPLAYVLEVGSTAGATDLAVLTLGPSESFLTARNVSPGTYYVRIRAATTGGLSPASPEVIVVVTVGPP